MQILARRPIHAGRLERWLGADKIASLQESMVGWYGPAINLRDVPGSVWITADGDFVGDFGRGHVASALDHLRDHLKQFWKRVEREPAFSQAALGAGFTSISDALARASSGQRQLINGNIAKTGSTGVQGSASSLWRAGNSPQSGGAGSAAPGGRALDKSTVGAMTFNNPGGSDTLHLVGADMSASVVNHSIMLYDRIFDVAKTMNSTTAEAVTGVPTRYQSTTVSAPDYIGGNFLFMEIGGTALAATAHNWTVCTYLDQSNSASTLPSVTGVSGGIVDRFDFNVPGLWFAPLEAGDVGIKALTQMQCNAAVATGAINFVIGHPIGIMSFPVIQSLLPFDWLTNRDQAPRIFNDAALAMFELSKPATTAATYTGLIYATSAAG